MNLDDPLSIDRLRLARETLAAAARTTRSGFLGAVGQEDALGVFTEATRNLTALVQYQHGTEAWEAFLDDETPA